VRISGAQVTHGWINKRRKKEKREKLDPVAPQVPVNSTEEFTDVLVILLDE